MEFFYVIMAGVASAAVMGVFLEALTKTQLVKVDLLGTVGVSVGGSREYSKLSGIGVHLVFGALFALLYTYAWNIVGLEGFKQLVLAGAIAGFGHGLVVSLVLFNFITEKPDFIDAGPIEEGFTLALTHVVAHIVYGVVLACLVSLL